MTAPRYAVPELVEFARAMLARVGLRDDIARDVATVLVDGDLMGHTTHGLALLAAYIGELDQFRDGIAGRGHRRPREMHADARAADAGKGRASAMVIVGPRGQERDGTDGARRTR